ncbi:MAG: FkbM family methyltransferase [Dokdonella sp.]
MRSTIVGLIKKVLGIHHQSGVEALPAMRSIGSQRHPYFIPEKLLHADSVCYCIGAGEDVSFDTELKIIYDCSVVILDPTPYGIDHFQKLKDATARGIRLMLDEGHLVPFTYRITARQLNDIQFVPIGVWNEKTVLTFHDPQLENYPSYSVYLFTDSEKVIRAPVDRLGNIMRELGHSELDLVKIEIEGAEYTVIDTIIEDQLDIKLIVVEFDEIYNHKPRDLGFHFRIKRCCDRLRKAGYVLIHSTPQLKRSFLRRDVFDQLKGIVSTA